MQLFRFFLMACALLLPLALSSCGGGGSKVQSRQEIRTTTTGQELSDLRKALDDGAISQKQYELEKKKILKRSK